jgi:hypothetical protein
MKVSRSKEESRVWFRSGRVFLAGDSHWYFQTREGMDVGPYESQFEAEIEAGLLKELLHDCGDADSIKAAMREFVLDSYAMGRPLTPRFREALQMPAAG